MSYLQAILKTEFSFIANTAGKLATFGLVAFFAYGLFPKNSVSPEFGLIMVFLAGLAGNLVMTGLIFWHAKKFVFIGILNISKKSLKCLFHTELPSFWE